MKTGARVWIHPHGLRRESVLATIDFISSNGRSIALSLHEKPAWCGIIDGYILHQEDFRIAMLLHRLEFGPWLEIVNHGHYEIEE